MAWNQVNGNRLVGKLLTEYGQVDREDINEPTSVLITNEEAEAIANYGIGTGQVNLTHGRVNWSLTGFAGGTSPHISYKVRDEELETI